MLSVEQKLAFERYCGARRRDYEPLLCLPRTVFFFRRSSFRGLRLALVMLTTSSHALGLLVSWAVAKWGRH
jgi:hypothetical protein